MSGSGFTSELLRDLAGRYGLSQWAAAPAERAPGPEGRYRQWIEEGRHGGMRYLADHAPLKYRPEAVLTGVQSVLSFAVSYYRPDELPDHLPGCGRIARYARGRDYHKPLGKRLGRMAGELAERFPGESFRAFVDTAPLDERYYAARAGLGFIGRNHALILNGGSWSVLGEILTTLRVDGGAFDFPEEPPAFAAACPPDCRRCIDHCPTGALRKDGSFDARLCLSYLTIEHEGVIPEELRGTADSRIFGCDTCQNVCPLNRDPEVTGWDDFKRDIAGEAVELAPLLEMGDREAMKERFAGSPLMRASRGRLVSNAALAAGNTGCEDLAPKLELLAERDADRAVREHAAWAARRC
jgi:epoxyqueuosine reductase